MTTRNVRRRNRFANEAQHHNYVKIYRTMEAFWDDKNLSLLIKNLFNKFRTLSVGTEKKNCCGTCENSFSIVFFFASLHQFSGWMAIYWTFMHTRWRQVLWWCSSGVRRERLLKNERERANRRMKLLNQGMIVRVSRCDNFESSQLDITTHVRCWSHEICDVWGGWGDGILS